MDYADTEIIDYLGVGQRRGYGFDTKTLDDKSSISVNLASRDLLVNVADFTLPSAGHGLGVSHTYNSRVL